jgi:ComF family protein
MLKEYWEKILDLFFPPYCVICNKIGTFLCPDCQSSFLKIKAQSCPGCNKISPKGNYCHNCRPKNSLSGVLAYGYFKDERLKKAIHDFKYNKYSALAPSLASLLIEKIKEEEYIFDAIAFVPISKKRQAWRGFNQAELLAIEISRAFTKPLIKLKKLKETETQVGLKKRARQKNLENAFGYQGERINYKKILLVDDVLTTGTTLNECARVLKKNGAKSVFGIVLAKE